MHQNTLFSLLFLTQNPSSAYPTWYKTKIAFTSLGVPHAIIFVIVRQKNSPTGFRINVYDLLKIS